MSTASPGTLSYFDIPVADRERAETFFGGLFGWQFVPANTPGYRMIPNAAPAAGLDGTGTPGPIRVYFQVDSVADTVARVRTLGGTAAEPVRIPAGWYADCTDDQGTAFRVWED